MCSYFACNWRYLSLSRIEPVKMILADGTTKISPDISPRHTVARASYINSCTALDLQASEISNLLHKMSLSSSVSKTNPDEILVGIPATRPDILHECDEIGRAHV